MTKQEMFDRAWRGLKAQGWEQSLDENGESCVYLNAQGRRCAWGHVDPDRTARYGILTVRDLAQKGIGVAATLDEERLSFAMSLQTAHDEPMGFGVERMLRVLAERHGLTIPDEVQS